MKTKNCPVCGKGDLVRVTDITAELGGYVFVHNGVRCTQCGEEFIDEADSQKAIEAARKLGVWPEPLKLYRKLSEAGRGIVLRIPSDIERQLNLKPGEEVAISKVGRKVVIEPLSA
ncbi:YgiT-type zinc finger protein [Candidatus Micrarchaeota archaeon]|nr:YgiT-type zinc finger protein [Candidatus Micrarchaeota archaeon]